MVLLKLFKRSDVVNLTLSCYSMEHDSTKVFLLLQPIYTLCNFSFFLKFVILSCADYSDLELKQKQKKKQNLLISAISNHNKKNYRVKYGKIFFQILPVSFRFHSSNILPPQGKGFPQTKQSKLGDAHELAV